MARKKQLVDFVPSKYQSDIFDFIQHGVGNLVIEASAGSGKTSTLIKALNLIDESKQILFCAFNKDIVLELKKRIPKDKSNIDIRTVHSLGYLMIQRNFPDKSFVINETKYKSHILSSLALYTDIYGKRLTRTAYGAYIDNVCKIVDLCRYNMVHTISQCKQVVDRHDISLIDDEMEVALKVLDWGQNNIGDLDYGDMVWLPNVLALKPLGLKFDFVFGDEAQDFSIAQKDLILKCRKIDTRFIFCGDRNQCIYSFASASPDTFNDLISMPNTTSLPLSISYRCGKKIVEYAQHIVPNIEPNPSNQDGQIIEQVALQDVQDGDMIICRNNAPLIKAYSILLAQNKKCIIRGKDIGMNLKKLVIDTKQDNLSIDLQHDGVFPRLYAKLFTERDSIAKRTQLDADSVMGLSIMANKLDTIRALMILADGISTKDELIQKIESVFSDRKTNGIMLSTIHKAKGLESNNVYILCHSIMPSKYARQDWEKEQERNLQYVAYTRSKAILGFISESEVSAIESCDESLDTIEAMVSKTLHIKFEHTKMTVEMANVIAANAEDQLLPTSKDNNITLSESKRKTLTTLASLMHKRTNKLSKK